jgi:cytochrome oxidase assembly protein ShyY1
MANKPQGKSWGEIQLTIATLAITATLGFWNLFSTPEKAQAAVKVAQTATPPPPPTPTETAEPTATAQALRPVKIIFGGQAPKQTVVQVQVQSNAQAPAKRRKGGGDDSNNSGGGSPPSQPPSTGSS